MTRTRNGNGWISPGLTLDFHLFSFLCSAITFLDARQRCFIPDSSPLVEKDPVHKPVPLEHRKCKTVAQQSGKYQENCHGTFYRQFHTQRRFFLFLFQIGISFYLSLFIVLKIK